jgi:hypothetical protein
MEIATFWLIAAGKCSYRLLDSRWVLLKGYRKAVGKCPKAIGKPLGNSKRILEHCWEMPKYPLLANRRGVRIAQRLLAKTWQFLFISSELLHFCLHLLKVEEAVENFKNAQWFFSYFSSYQPNHLQPDSNWFDSPFSGVNSDTYVTASMYIYVLPKSYHTRK